VSYIGLKCLKIKDDKERDERRKMIRWTKFYENYTHMDVI